MKAENKNLRITSEKEYEKLLLSGVMCSCCGDKLSNDEILTHRFVGITESKDMMCQIDWMRVAYMQGRVNE
jgi:hypothetical protein